MPSSRARSRMRRNGSATGTLSLVSGGRLRRAGARGLRGPGPLVHGAAGIALSESKRALVVRRLANHIASLGLSSFEEYTALVRADDSGSELIELLDLIATNETHFFREPAHFDFLEQRVYPLWLEQARKGERSRVIRVWSSACSTGQEPYSLAMQLLSKFPASDGWSIELLATDVSTRALATAASAVWSLDKAHEIPPHFLKRYMRRGVGEQLGKMRASEELRGAVRFLRVNLTDEHYPVSGSFDLIFCRNVLIYFTPEGRASVIDKLTKRLATDGLLFVGHAESLHAHRAQLHPLMPTVYTRAS